MALNSSFSLKDPEELAGLLSSRQIHLFRKASKELNAFSLVSLSILAHFLTIGLTMALMFIMAFLGWTTLKFKRPALDNMIEFQLVEGPDQKPNRPTNIRSSQNSRAGGQVNKNMRKAQNLKAKGNPNAKNGSKSPAQQKQQAKPQQPKQQPKAAQKPAQQPSNQKPSKQQQPSKPVATPTQNQQQQPTQKPTAPKAPKPRVSQTTTTSTTSTTTTTSTTGLKPSKVGTIAIPVSGGGTATGQKPTGPITGGFPSSGTGKSSGSPSGQPGSTGSNSGPSFQSTNFSGNPGGGKPGNPGTPGNGGKNKNNQGGGNDKGDGSGVNAKKQVDLGPYMRELTARIRRNWSPSNEDRSKRIVMMLSISKDGRLVAANIVKGSDSPAANEAARLAVQRSAPFQPLPSGFSSSKINVEFTFDQNVYNGGYR